MQLRSFTLVPDHIVKSELIRANSEANLPIARVIEVLAEAQARKLHLADGYPTMVEFCLAEMNLSEDEAYKRLQVATVARAFPAILPMLADGRLHQTAAVMLGPHLTLGNAEALLAATAHKSKKQIAMVLAEHCPRPDVPTCVRQAALVPEPTGALMHEAAPVRAAMPVQARDPVPTSPGRFAVQFMLDDAAHAELEYARSLCRHAVPSGDIAEFYKWAVREAIKQGEKRAFAATSRPRASKGAPKGRTVPADMKRQVWARDGGRCTFVSASCRRCSANSRLEFDHIEAMARGGETTVENLRLRCRGHNQYEAERTFGAGFMARKRAEARERNCDVSEQSPTLVPEPAISTIPEQVAAEQEVRTRRKEIVPYLRALGFRMDEARRGAAMCDHLHDSSLEHRVKFAISRLGRARFERATVSPYSCAST